MSKFGKRWERAREREAARLELVKDPVVAPAQFAAEEKRVAICSPMQDMCHTAFMVSCLHMVSHTMNAPDRKGVRDIQFFQIGSSILPFSRFLLARKSIEFGATHILWIDSDMVFPPDMLIRFAGHNKEIVGANCIARREPFMNTARYASGGQVYTSASSTGLEEVARLGFGVLYHSIELLKSMPLPWYSFDWMPDLQVYRGEDFAFCDAAKAAGIPMYVDHDLSKEISHLGVYGLNPLMVSPESHAKGYAAQTAAEMAEKRLGER